MENDTGFMIQRDRTTVANRYPEIFGPVSKLVNETVSEPRVLSFGCSTGYESYDLAVRYFPHSTVIGLDISSEALQTAKAERSIGNRIIYDISSRENLKLHGPYDVIFAMSVLCRWPELANQSDSSQLFPFSIFSDMVEILHRNLTVGGLLVIYNASYDFKDTDLFAQYKVESSPGITTSGYVKRFNKDGKELTNFKGSDVIFRKQR